MVTLLRALWIVLNILSWMIIIDVILSYIPSLSRNPLAVGLRRITNVILEPIRRAFGARRVGDAYIDFSPLVALVIIMILQRVVLGLIGAAQRGM